MSDLTSLLPVPRHATVQTGVYPLAAGRLILLNAAAPQELWFSAGLIRRTLLETAGLDWEVTASWATPSELIGLTLRVDPAAALPSQGYTLVVDAVGISITARDAAGAFYGACTLVQMLQAAQAAGETGFLPCLYIRDWPDFSVRGVMLDISRDKVPSLETMYGLVDILAGWKINQLQLYTEHTFAYRRHPEVWAQASPFTGQDILALDAYCRERQVELVPNQNSFGHMARWLIHSRYSPLAELMGTFSTPWGHTMQGPFSLCPLDPGSLDLVGELYDELLPHFSSRMFNVGCDETVDVGQGRSKAACEVRGSGRVYLDYMLKVYREVKAHGRTMQFWGDIIVQHPELIPELPRDVIALEWGYEADHPFDEHGLRFAEAGIPFYVCPGTSSWCSVAGRTDNALGNLLSAAENGLKHGATGYLNTDWGDAGHWQMLPVSYLGFVMGAAYSWALDANRELDVAAALSRHAFRDGSGSMGRVAYDMGNVYKAGGLVPPNGSALFWTLQWPLQTIRGYNVPPAALDGWREAIEGAIAPLGRARMACPDATLITHEYEHTAHLLRHACRRGLLALGQGDEGALRRELDADMGEIIAEYRALWLARNRPGGLADSVALLERARTDYGDA
jgi:hexosaminidase